MADPKYANLPGIVFDQPDVYETSDEPNGKQSSAQMDAMATDEIEKSRISHAQRTGFYIPRSEYQYMGRTGESHETLLQRYERIQLEMKELLEELGQIKEDLRVEGKAVSPVLLAQNVEHFQDNLAELHLGDVHGSQKHLMNHSGFSDPGKQVNNPSATPAGSIHQVTNLEHRLEKLEAVLGSKPEQLASLAADTHSKTLMEAVSLLNARSSLLEPAQLDHIELRLAALSHKLAQVTEKQHGSIQELAKISELYEVVSKWNVACQSLPIVLERLTALNDLHYQALQFGEALKSLDGAQQLIGRHLKADDHTIQQVKKEMSENMTTIKANFEKLDARVATLK